MLSKSKLIIAVAAAPLLALAGLGIAWASIPDSNGVIHGCYKTSSPGQGALVVIDSATQTCPSGTTPLNWNQTGPQGPAGPAGPSGAASMLYVQEGSGTLQPGLFNSQYSCPTGY